MKPALQDLARMTSRQMRQSIRGHHKGFFYSTAPTAVAAITGTVLGLSTTTINIDAGSHFFVTGLAGYYLLTTGLLATNPILHAEPQLQMTDQSSGINLFDRAVRWGNVVGSGNWQPFPFDPPYLLWARSAVLVTFENPETVSYTCSVTLLGYKVFLN